MSEVCIWWCNLPRKSNQSIVFNPYGVTVFSTLLQYSSLLVGSDPSVLSIRVIPLWSFEEKCSKTCGCIFSSPLLIFWLLQLSLNLLVVEPTYCSPHALQESKKIKHLSLHLSWWFILFCSLVWSDWKTSVSETFKHTKQRLLLHFSEPTFLSRG